MCFQIVFMVNVVKHCQSCLIHYVSASLTGRGPVASWLVRSSPNREVRFEAMAGA